MVTKVQRQDSIEFGIHNRTEQTAEIKMIPALYCCTIQQCHIHVYTYVPLHFHGGGKGAQILLIQNTSHFLGEGSDFSLEVYLPLQMRLWRKKQHTCNVCIHVLYKPVGKKYKKMLLKLIHVHFAGEKHFSTRQ